MTGDLDELTELDEKIKSYAEKVYELLKRDKRARKKRRIARNVNTIYRTGNLIEAMISDVKSKLSPTKDLDIILREWVVAWASPLGYPGGPLPVGHIYPTGYSLTVPPTSPFFPPPPPIVPAPAIPTPNESTELEDVLKEMKRVYNLLVQLFNLEKKTLKEIR